MSVFPSDSEPAPESGGDIGMEYTDGAFLDRLDGVDIFDRKRVPDADLVSMMQGYQRLLNRIQTEQARVVGVLRQRWLDDSLYESRDTLDQPGVKGEIHRDVDRGVDDEVRAALVWGQRKASRLTDLAAITRLYPHVENVCRTGRLEPSKAAIVVQTAQVLTDPAKRDKVIAKVIPIAHTKTHAQLYALMAREILAADPDAAAARHRDKRRTRGFELYPDAIDGVADLELFGIAADDAIAVYNHVDAIAKAFKHAGDPRTLPQLRADVAVALLAGRDTIAPVDPTTDGPATDGRYPTDDDPEHTKPDSPNDVDDDPESAGPDTPDTGCPEPESSNQSNNPREPVEPGEPNPDAEPESGPDAPFDPDPESGAGSSAGKSPAEPESGPESPTGPGNDGEPGNDGDGGGRGRLVLRASTRAESKTQLVVGLTELLGLTQILAAHGFPDHGLPADLAGYGPIHTELARRVVFSQLDNPDAEFEILVTGKDGRVRQLHRMDNRVFAGLLRDALIAVWQTCSFPTCTVPAIHGEGDHTHPHAKGGPTEFINGHLPCKAHHQAKTKGTWHVTHPEPGLVIWTSPTGKTYYSQTPQLTQPEEPSPAGPDPPPF